jgi:hypothetical protein
MFERDPGGEGDGEHFHGAALRGASRARLTPIRGWPPSPVSLRAARG